MRSMSNEDKMYQIEMAVDVEGESNGDGFDADFVNGAGFGNYMSTNLRELAWMTKVVG